jgi:CubicO group peptidase (beta-lactamase class C family)
MPGEGQLKTHTTSPRFQRRFIIIISLLLAGPTPALSTEPVSLLTTVDSFLRPYVESHNFSGMVLIAQGDSILMNTGFGMADYENAVPNTAETRFMIASVSKTYTVAAIVLLQERDQLNMDDTVDRFIPGFPRGNEITIDQLLTHMSGLPRTVFFPDYNEKSKMSHTTKDLVEWISDKPLAFAPGERYGYSNANYILLAHIIEQVSGLSYGDFLQSNILAPLGLQATGHQTDAAAAIDNLAKGHVPVNLTDVGSARHYDYSIATGAGSMYSTTEDLLTWFKEQQRDPVSMEYGWITDSYLDKELIYKTGWDGVGFGVEVDHYVADDLTIIVLTNFNVSSITGEIAENIAAIFFDSAYEPLHLSTKPNVEAAVLNDMTGLYRFGPDFYVPDATIRVTESNGQLLIPGDSQSPTGGLLPVSGLEFIHRQQWFKVIFEQDADQKIVGMQYGRFKAKKESNP